MAAPVAETQALNGANNDGVAEYNPHHLVSPPTPLLRQHRVGLLGMMHLPLLAGSGATLSKNPLCMCLNPTVL